MLKKNGFKGAKAAAADKYLYCVAGVYDDADAAAGAYKKLQELGLNPYNAEIKGWQRAQKDYNLEIQWCSDTTPSASL